MIKASSLKIPFNHVLVHADPHLETYQMSGRELNIIATDFKYEKGERINVKERNASVHGRVYAVPDNIIYNGSLIEKVKRENTLFKIENGEKVPVNISMHRYIGNLTEGSLMYDTQMEVNVGDRVNFSYQAHKKAKDEKKFIETDMGEMMLIKYDLLFMTVSEDNKPKKMLNGWVLIEPEEIDIKKEDGKEFIEHSHGLVTLVPKNKFKKTRKTQVGKIVNFGSRCKGYIQYPKLPDYVINFNINDKVVYDPRTAQKLEYDTHQIMSDKALHLVQRKDIKYVHEEIVEALKLNKKELCLI